MTKNGKPLICCICQKPIEPNAHGWTGGHNAYPVQDGRCCEDCNYDVVLPYRLHLIRHARKSR